MSLVRVDCHLHTVASGDAVTTLDQLAERAAAERLDVVFITDHNEISAAAAASDLGVRVIVGEEIRTPDGDIIGLFLTERVPYVLPVAEVVARIRSQGGLVYAPHPFDDGRSSLGRVLPGLCAAGAVDIVEVFNAKIETQVPNERASALATAYALPDTGLSSSPAPWIASDQSDYAPGSTVHLTGGSWQPGEAVQIFTNDSVGNTWSQTDNVTADASGNLTGTGVGDPGTYTFTRIRATGGTISYQLTIIATDPDGYSIQYAK